MALLVLVVVAYGLGKPFAFADEGALDTSQPKGITPEEIIQHFAAKEKEFKQGLDQYSYRESAKMQTLEGDSVDGEFQEAFDVTFDDRGHRVKNVVFAPLPTLTRISMSREDYDDLENGFPMVLTSDDINQYNVLYAGQQQEDELHCYVFDVAPKQIEKNKRYFQGRIWVDDRDFQIVKTYGQMVPETRAKKGKVGENENLFPKFTTWREQVDGKYWFPTYTRADDTLHFALQDVKIRMVVRYANYKRFGSNVTITYQGKEIPKAEGQQEKPQSPPPQ
ncbi:MAG TPA: hypothetical protein VEK33_16390 [Terriglobales bacterium]|nr:hypothetical protein [Terriglobales bacterium]